MATKLQAEISTIDHGYQAQTTKFYTRAMVDYVLLHDAEDHWPLKSLQKLDEKSYLAPSDSYLFGPLKEAHHGIHLENEKARRKSMHQWLKRQDHAIYQVGKHSLVRGWVKTVEKDKDFIEK